MNKNEDAASEDRLFAIREMGKPRLGDCGIPKTGADRNLGLEFVTILKRELSIFHARERNIAFERGVVNIYD